MFGRKKDNASKQTRDERGAAAFREYLKSYEANLLALISEREISKRPNEPLSPWLCYHFPLQFNQQDLDARGIEFSVYAEQDSFFWHTLDGAACTQAFLAHFRAIAFAERVSYFKRFDLGPRWADREAWFQLAFEDENVSEAEYEAAHAEIFGSL